MKAIKSDPHITIELESQREIDWLLNALVADYVKVRHDDLPITKFYEKLIWILNLKERRN